MMKRRRSFGFWVAVVFVVGGTLYPLSLAPALRLANRGWIPHAWIFAMWGPVNEVYARSPAPIRSAVDWYLSQLGLPEEN